MSSPIPASTRRRSSLGVHVLNANANAHANAVANEDIAQILEHAEGVMEASAAPQPMAHRSKLLALTGLACMGLIFVVANGASSVSVNSPASATITTSSSVEEVPASVEMDDVLRREAEAEEEAAEESRNLAKKKKKVVTLKPTKKPTKKPTVRPTLNPTAPTTPKPTASPTLPTTSPTKTPTTGTPTRTPTMPTAAPTVPDPATIYNIDIYWTTTVSNVAIKNAFEAARLRWMRIITGDIASTYTYKAGAMCYGNVNTKLTTDYVVDDLLIFADIVKMDGVYGKLGAAGPCVITNTNGILFPRVGLMNFDVDDLANMITLGTLQAVVLHEMGHVIGLGAMWASFKLEGTTSPKKYLGVNGKEGLLNLGGTGNPIIEEDMYFGSTGGHWDEKLYTTELMTPVLQKSSAFSIMTLKSLKDLGYVVDITQADTYTLPSASGRLLRGGKNKNQDNEPKTIVTDDVLSNPEVHEAEPYVNGKPKRKPNRPPK